MNFVMDHAPGTGSIVRHVGQQSSPLYHGFLLYMNTCHSSYYRTRVKYNFWTGLVLMNCHVVIYLKLMTIRSYEKHILLIKIPVFLCQQLTYTVKMQSSWESYQSLNSHNCRAPQSVKFTLIRLRLYICKTKPRCTVTKRTGDRNGVC